jgi:hypothetical protein
VKTIKASAYSLTLLYSYFDFKYIVEQQGNAQIKKPFTQLRINGF